ncbi:DNA packaging terminase subunit 1 [Vespertilionid gammaherpesvirus 1]|uniref:DNA packaging terminase subunit 1 n=1 Tax=Vespertilionid gammaherpesvirus 1 TaxID=2560830 RepID=A0A109QFM3_9GAMA|nr:DNA packaging terminase subunit 1 [Myotis gammaherpesvirus 8]AMA67390.1 DNA packaging terminase subunit 1 [Vespertilionid gammaherpesvirus 1]
MILSGIKKTLLENYNKSITDEKTSDLVWVSDMPAIITKRNKSERMAHPYIGVISRTNLYSSVLEFYCNSCNPIYKEKVESDIGTMRQIAPFSPTLTHDLSVYLKSLCSNLRFTDSEAKVEFFSSVMTQKTIRGCPVFNELNRFIINLSSFLNGCYSTKSHTIEPFQKQLILHTFYFLVSIKAPEATNKLFEIFKDYFGLYEMNQETLQTFKQKSSVYLIPRRHGKTWIVVAIISMLLATVENLHIGYVAHQKHVANSVFSEIINTLYRWFPTANIYIKKENGTIMFTNEGKRPSTLMCATCFNKNSIRGQTFNLLYIDEANFIKKDSLPSILGFMLQKDAKLIFISSVNSSDQTTSFLFKLKNADEKMLNVVSYVCPEHREDFSLQDAIVSCPCYRLHIPVYITIDESIKNTTNLFLDGAFTTELMGDASSVTKTNMHRIVGESAMTQFDLCRVEITNNTAISNLDSTVYLYIDPAYTNNCEASGTGIAAVVTLRNNRERCILLGIEHFFLKELTGASTMQIAGCANALIKSIMVLHPFVTTARIAIEGNSSQDSAVAIATFLNECCPIPTEFYFHVDKTTNLQWPIYILGTEKTKAFELFIYAMNSNSISCSQTIISNTIKLSYDPVSYLLEQLRALKAYPLKDGSFTYCAKQRLVSDDTLVAVVMAHFLATTDNHTFKNFTHKHT